MFISFLDLEKTEFLQNLLHTTIHPFLRRLSPLLAALEEARWSFRPGHLPVHPSAGRIAICSSHLITLSRVLVKVERLQNVDSRRMQTQPVSRCLPNSGPVFVHLV